MDATNCWSPPGTIIHASPVPPLPARATAGAYVALCGTVVRNVTTVVFRPGAMRCPLCTAQLIRVRTLMELRGYDQVEFDL